MVNEAIAWRNATIEASSWRDWWEYANALGGGDIPRSWDDIPVQYVQHRLVKPGQDYGCGVTSLRRVLLDSFPTDVHTLPYVSDLCQRLKQADHGDVPVAFPMFLYDIDAHDEEPEDDVFAYLCWLAGGLLWEGEGVPRASFLYETAGGARVGILLNQPISNKEEYKAKYVAVGKLLTGIVRYAEPLKVDLAPKGWTSIMRARGVVREDKRYCGYNARLYVVGDHRLDPGRIEVKVPKAREPKQRTVVLTGPVKNDPVVRRYLEGCHLGERNVQLNRVVFWIYAHYPKEVANEATDALILPHALDLDATGAPDGESKIESTVARAREAGMIAWEDSDA